MFKRFIKGLVIVLPCVSVFSLTYADENIKNKPVYQGQVSAIDKPIIIRYTPLSERQTIDSITIFGKINDRVIEEKSIGRGAIEILKDNENLNLVISAFTTELINKNGKETITDNLKMSFDISPFGKVHDFSLYSPELTPKEIQQTKEVMSGMVKEVIVQFPASGIETGYEFKADFDLGGMELKGTGTVLGKTIFNDREAIVIDYRGPLSLLVINRKKIKGTFDGYYILDTATGVFAYSEVYLQAKFSHKNKINFYRTVTTKIH
ncbi:hypothetical protein WH95_03165 [Kiloniella litopenaei]|uniref:Uncharacterized protein n=1 Tax=Kiloniella litopenaei TaxID=1549748 RepID=A0A0M2R9G9_9PROT|nr:hypothetical protein [Kiloniella litopenaei]KKJ78316.1 hypothetical protein WH95_03165 [Kiloniella litopenaei]